MKRGPFIIRRGEFHQLAFPPIRVQPVSDRNRSDRSEQVSPDGAAHPDALVSDEVLEELLAVDELLTRLEAEHPRRARIVECRLFGGMSLEEVADALGLSPAVVRREWRIAAVRLYQQLQDPDGS